VATRNDNWYLPPDWRCLLPLSFAPVIVLLAVSAAVSLFDKLENGNVLAIYAWGLGAGLLSAALLFLARWPLYRAGRFWTIGPRELDRHHRRLYFAAYAVFAIAVLLLAQVLRRTADL